MVIIDIVDWIANMFVLGLAIILWGLGILIIGMVISVLKRWLNKEITEKNNA